MIEKALAFSFNVHKDQLRKDNSPYIVHPLTVAIELAKAGADDNLIAAGLLHDTIEDANVTNETIKREFGDDVASLVIKDSEDKSISWEERKQKIIDELKRSDDRYKMLVLADKLSNLRSIDMSMEKDGDMIWSKSKRDKKSQYWFFSEILNACTSLKDSSLYQEYNSYLCKIFKEEA